MTQTATIDMTDQKPDVNEQINKLETFIARRFDEISMEIEATSQLMEMAEEDAGKRFSDMLAMLNAISVAGDGSSPANSGRELEAVVKETEEAATIIMDAADNIKEQLEKNEDFFVQDMHMATVSEAIFKDVQKILMACGFQDLVSQRVTTALDNIRNVQETLDSTLSKFGIDTSQAKEQAVTDMDGLSSEADMSSQADIDALFD